mmetsp:Transcript_12270/g.34604  ORF Transcript_12270/g.34604 Transcript_12270/m.34604 type:complete len:219 (-) Transcript_12270:493-1149(-)
MLLGTSEWDAVRVTEPPVLADASSPRPDRRLSSSAAWVSSSTVGGFSRGSSSSDTHPQENRAAAPGRPRSDRVPPSGAPPLPAGKGVTPRNTRLTRMPTERRTTKREAPVERDGVAARLWSGRERNMGSWATSLGTGPAPTIRVMTSYRRATSDRSDRFSYSRNLMRSACSSTVAMVCFTFSLLARRLRCAYSRFRISRLCRCVLCFSSLVSWPRCAL